MRGVYLAWKEEWKAKRVLRVYNHGTKIKMPLAHKEGKTRNNGETGNLTLQTQNNT